MSCRILWGVLTLLFLAVRFSGFSEIFSGGRLQVNDTDPYYRLHRIESMTEKTLAYPLHDPDLSPPSGFDVPWPIGLDLLLAVPLKIFGVKDRSTLEFISGASIPILSLPALWATGAVVHAMAGPAAGLLAGTALALFPPAIRASSFGRIDHHVLELLFPILLLAYALSGRRWILPLLLGLAPAFWPQAWVCGFFLALFWLSEARYERWSEAWRIFLSSAVLSLFVLAFSSRFGSFLVSLHAFSWWAPLTYLFFSLFFGMRCLGARLRVLATFLMVFGALFFRFHGGGILELLRPTGGILATTSEAMSPFSFPVRSWWEHGFLAYFPALAWCFLELQHRPRWRVAFYFLCPMLLASFQIRFLAMASPFIAAAAVLFCHRIICKPKVFAVVAAAIAFLPAGYAARAAKGEVHPLYRAVQSASEFLRQRNENLRLQKSATAVAAHWDFGHWLLYGAGTPVTAHPFQDESSMETMRMFASENEMSLSLFLAQHSVRYLLIETPTLPLNRWLSATGEKKEKYLRGRTPTPEFYKLTFARFFVKGGVHENGDFPENWRLIYVSSEKFFDGKYPALKIFERVPGALIRVKLKGGPYNLKAKIDTPEGPLQFSQTRYSTGGGLFEWRVPYAATDSHGVHFDGRYRVEALNGKVRQVTPSVSEAAVLRGEVVR